MVESAAEKMVLIWECNLLYQQVKYVCFLWNWVEMSSYQAFIQKKKKDSSKGEPNQNTAPKDLSPGTHFLQPSPIFSCSTTCQQYTQTVNPSID